MLRSEVKRKAYDSFQYIGREPSRIKGEYHTTPTNIEKREKNNKNNKRIHPGRNLPHP